MGHDDGVFFVYRQVGRSHICYCYTHRGQHEVTKRKLSHAKLDSRYRRSFVETLREEHCVEWAAEILRMRHALRVHVRAISQSLEIIQSKMAIMSITIVQCEATFSDKKKSQLSYTRAFKDGYGVRLIDACI